MALGAALLGGVNGFNQGQAISQQRRLNDLTIAQQLAQASQQQQAQLQLDSILEGLSQPLTTPGFNPLAGTPLGNTATPAGNDLGAVLSQVQTAQDQGVQPQLSSIPQALNEISIQDVISQSQQLRTQAQSGIAQLAANPLATPALIREQAELANSRIQEFNQQNLTPLSNSIGVIQQSLLDNDINRTRAIGEAVVSRAGTQNQQILRQTLGLDGTDEELEANIRLAARAFGVGEESREQELRARGTGLAAQLSGEADLRTRPDEVLQIGDQQVLSRQGQVVPQTATRANNIQLEGLRQQGTDRTAQSNERVAEINNANLGNNLPKAVTEQAKQDVADLADARKAVSEQLPTIQALDQARQVLEAGNFETGAFSSVRGNFLRIGATLGVDGLADAASDFELINKVGKQLGIQTLQLVGGNDTERELITAIETNVGADKLPQTNRKLLSEKLAAIDVITQRPRFLEDWLSENASTLAKNENGDTFSQAWRKQQKSLFELQKARDALRRGAPRESVIQLLQSEGIDPSRL